MPCPVEITEACRLVGMTEDGFWGSAPFAIWNGIEETLAAIHRAGGEPNWDSCEAIRDARWLQFRGIERGLTRYRYLYAKLARSMNCRKTSHSHHASSACSGDGKTTSFALTILLRRSRLNARSHPAFCPMLSEMSPISLIFGTKAAQNAFCPQI